MLWRLSKEDITKALDKKFGDRWVDFYIPSGLYLWVDMIDGSNITVYDWEIEDILYA